MRNFLPKLLIIQMLLLLSLCPVPQSFTETPTETPTPTVSTTPSPTPDTSGQEKDLVNKIKDLEGKISDLQGQEKTLATQISVMNNQVKLTEYRISATKSQISQLSGNIAIASKKITKLNDALSNVTKILLSRIIATYETGSLQPLQLVAVSNVNNYVTRANYLKVVQAHDKALLYQTQQAKTDYANQKKLFEIEQKKMQLLQDQLETYNQDLTKQQENKKMLLAQTQGSEANYQRILAETRAQLSRFEGFVTSQGGASLLSGQTVCDDWGCYYNQRDSQWGGTPLNGTQYTLASDGCLVTSMAMVYTHYGHRDVTPQSINMVSSNFAGIPPALLRFDIVANGVSAQRVNATIDSVLANGDPVIIGISYDGGPLSDHFLVLISGSDGNYMMNDPFTPNGHNIPMTSKYPVSSIRQVYKVVM